MTTFSIEANFDANDPDSDIECSVHSADLTFAETKDAMIRLRDHLDARIAAETECPFSPKYKGKI